MADRRRARDCADYPSSVDVTPKRPRKKPRIRRRNRNPNPLASSSSSTTSITVETICGTPKKKLIYADAAENKVRICFKLLCNIVPSSHVIAASC